MKKIQIQFVISCIFIFLINGSVFSANEYFRSIASGDWNSISTWQMSTNSGTTWIAATLTPTDASGEITVRYPNIVTVTVNVNADQLTIDSGSVSINTGIILTLLNGSGNDLTVLKGGSVTGAGTFQTQGTVVLNLRSGSVFTAAFKVNTGTATVAELASPYDGKLLGNVTVDAGAVLNTNNSGSYTLSVYGNITNNGTITGSGSTLKFYGSSLTNNSVISSPNLSLDSTSTLSGAGSYSGGNIIVTANGNISLLNNVTFSISTKLTINNGGTFSANTFILTFTSGTFEILSGGTVVNSGTVKTQGTVTINSRTGSAFRANLNVASGTTIATELSSPYNGRLFGNVTVDNGATLSSFNSSSYTLYIYGNLTNNGTISGSGSAIKFFGSALVNTGSIASPEFRFDSTSTVTSSGTFTGADIVLGGFGNVSLLSNVTLSPTSEIIINTGGVLSANTRILTVTSGEFRVMTGGTVLNSGTVRTQGNVTLNPRTGSSFNANLIVASGTTIVWEPFPYNARLFGNVTVDNGAVLSSYTSVSYTLHIYGNLTNNGTLTGSGSNVKFFGAALINNGSIASPNFNFDSTTSVSGSGTYTGSSITISANGNVTLLNNVTFSPVSEFKINSGGDFTANGNIFTYNSGTFTIFTGGTVANSGTIRTQNNVYLNPRSGSSFNADLIVNTGTTTVSELFSPYDARLYGNIIVDTGAVLNTNNSSSYTLFVFGNITNNGAITGNGNIEVQSGVHSLQGTGSIVPSVILLTGAIVNLNSSHKMSSVVINSGAAFNIGNNTLKLTASNPIIQNGTFTNAGSKIEYNGTASQSISTLNITYYTLRINNVAGTILTNNITLDTLNVILGDLDLSGKIITLPATGLLTETYGNTVKGSTGYITTTRNVGIPSSLNVGGLGAVLTATTNLGNTEVRRGHTVQTGLNGGTSIRRYYDITPANNSGLTATLVYKFDDTELNGKPEPSLKLFKSTNTGSTWLYQGGSVNIAANEITLPGITSFSRWSADSSKVSAAIGLIMEGFYNTGTNNLNMTDTVRAYLRNISSPYAVVDSAIGLLDSLTFKSALQFTNASTGAYYIQLKHRNSLETWSKNPVNYIQDSTLNYDFTFAANQAFGNNEILKGTKYCLYSGDVSQDGNIDLTDVVLTYNSSSSFATGYVNTDVNGNSIVDLTDVLIVSNNASKFIVRKSPLNP